MNPLTLTALVAPILIALIPLVPPPALAQAGKKITGGGFESGGGFDSGKVGVETTAPEDRPPIVIQEVAVTPERTWKNRDGKMIVGSLLAHRRPEGGEVPKDAAPVIVKEGKIRLMKDQKIFTLELESLSIEDQVYIEKLLETVAKHHAKPTPPE